MSHSFLAFALFSVLLTVPLSNVNCENILFFTGCGSYSQRISVWPLVAALTEKGHQVTFLSAFESKNPHPNVFDYVPKKLKNWATNTMDTLNVYELRKKGALLPFWFIGAPTFGITICEEIYSDPEAIAWIKSSKFDLVIIDAFMNDCAYGMAHIFNAKIILFDTTTVLPWFYDSFGIPDDTSWVSDAVFSFPNEMNFIHRVLTAAATVYWKLFRELWYLPKLEAITKKGLELDEIPSFSDIEKNTSLVFITTHYSQEHARAFPPNVIPIGGLALTGKAKPLPKDMEDFINKGKAGFVYISFGTVTEFSGFDEQIKKAFIDAVLKFPHIQFIWKLTNDIDVQLPANFLISKWVPQQDLLAHPKIKAFVTHAGLGSVTESIYHAAPLIAFPIFAEQDYNAGLVESKGVGIKMEITNLKVEDLENAILNLTTQEKYKKQMQKVSKIFRERPMTALQTALWWTEYVLKNDDTDYLKPSSMNQSWWVRRQVDVWLFISISFLLVSITSLYTTYILMKCITKRVLRSAGALPDSHKNSEKKVKLT
ncbi:unnamed protein product [Orchesella dallaii]|uniref:Glucuronosyltransferase n=1 Tax=Orchesella dallaii TaxID=48710 RepID=A0ABP1RWM9_9HEXA